MSDLKHRTPDELRSLIHWCVEKRAEHKEDKDRKTEMIKQLNHEIEQHGRASNNIGQKEAWARKYLAEKTLINNQKDN